jgi:hypothetical protein
MTKMITTQTLVDSIAKRFGGPDTIHVYFEGLTWRYAHFNWIQPISYFDIWEACFRSADPQFDFLIDFLLCGSLGKDTNGTNQPPYWRVINSSRDAVLKKA